LHRKVANACHPERGVEGQLQSLPKPAVILWFTLWSALKAANPIWLHSTLRVSFFYMRMCSMPVVVCCCCTQKPVCG